MPKIKVRGSAVQLALNALVARQEQLFKEGSLNVNVYVDYRLTPESFAEDLNEGGIILYFIRDHPANRWELDRSKFTILNSL